MNSEEEEGFYDEHIEKYVGRTLFIEGDEEEDSDEEEDEESNGTFDSGDALRLSEGGEGEGMGEGEEGSAVTVGGGGGDDGFEGRRDDGVVLATHFAWKGGYCADVSALIMCRQSAVELEEKGEGEEGGWSDVWMALPQDQVDSGSLSSFGDVQADISAHRDRAADGCLDHIELEESAAVIPVVRERVSPRGAPSTHISATDATPAHALGSHGTPSPSGSRNAVPHQQYLWALQVVQLCDSPLQRTRTVRMDADGDIDGVSVVCTIPLCNDMRHSGGDDAAEHDDPSYRVHIRVDDVTGVVSCVVHPVQIVLKSSHTDALASPPVVQGGLDDPLQSCHVSSPGTLGRYSYSAWTWIAGCLALTIAIFCMVPLHA